MSSFCLTTSEISEVFAEAIGAQGGRVSDTYDDGHRLFARSVLPHLAFVKTDDRLQGGVALKATADEICVYPYVFRQVCRNGLIMPHALEARRLTPADVDWETDLKLALRETITACCGEEVFEGSVTELRSSLDAGVNLALTVLPWLARVRENFSSRVAGQILDRFFGGKDHSRFGLVNAVTSVARDTTDPDQRWRLEELGGGIAARIDPEPPADAPGVRLVQRELLAVG